MSGPLSRSPQGYSIHIGVGSTNHLDPWNEQYDQEALCNTPHVASRMAQLAAAAGYVTRAILITPSDKSASGGSERRATKAEFLEVLGSVSRKIQAGDHLLITFAGHGQYWPGGSENPYPSALGPPGQAWVFEDDHLWDSELEPKLNSVDAGARILVISESCHSGSIAIAGNVPDEQSRWIDSMRFKPTIIQIGAAWDSEQAHVRGSPVFTDSLLSVWSNGAFRGDHNAFADAVRAEMANRGASATGQMWQEPRYFATGASEARVLAFEQLTPFWIGGSALTAPPAT